MNKKFFINTGLIFVASMALGMAVHGCLLHGEYAQLPNLFRAEADCQKTMPVMLLAHLIMAGAMVWIYRQGKQAKPFLAQGARFGLAMALVSTFPLYLIYYAVQPIPESMVVKQVVFDTISTVGLGIAIAWLERK